MRPTKTPDQTATNASALHKHVGATLLAIPAFQGYEVRQEYPVVKVDPNYPSGREKFDWVVLGARIVIECHGEQHYEPVCFGGIDEDQAKRNLLDVQERDESKRQAAVRMGWTYVVVKYDEPNITAEQLAERIKEELAATVVQRSMAAFSDIAKTVKANKTRKQGFNPGKSKWPSKPIPSRPFARKSRGDK